MAHVSNLFYEKIFIVSVQRLADTRRLSSEIWRNANGEIDRDGDLPARIVYDKNGEPYSQEWWSNGVLHREGGPAVESHPRPEHRSWQRYGEEWHRDGKLHRDNEEPAKTVRTREGRVVELVYAFNGLLHRTGGPAVITRNSKTGRIRKKEYWNYGQRMQAPPHRKKSASPS